jgi:hypothetical protein
MLESELEEKTVTLTEGSVAVTLADRSSLLSALPDCHSTMSSYVMKLLATREIEVKELLAAAKSRITV